MIRLAATVAVVLLSAAGSALAQETRSGTATALDGGTLELGGAQLRLWGVQVSDPDTALGWMAWQSTKDLVARGPISCTLQAPERWRCRIATGHDLGALLVIGGVALTDGPAYEHEETIARIAGTGFWRPPGRDGR